MEALITKFYTAFQNLDAETMASCYHPNVEFEDPGFGKLKGTHASNMCRMLCRNSTDLKLTFDSITDNSAHWEDIYTFSQTGRKVHNIIDAKFEFKDGLISKHTDDFNLHSWAKQALGFKGLVLGGTSFFKKKLHLQTGKLLAKFERKMK